MAEAAPVFEFPRNRAIFFQACDMLLARIRHFPIIPQIMLKVVLLQLKDHLTMFFDDASTTADQNEDEARLCCFSLLRTLRDLDLCRSFLPDRDPIETFFSRYIALIHLFPFARELPPDWSELFHSLETVLDSTLSHVIAWIFDRAPFWLFEADRAVVRSRSQILIPKRHRTKFPNDQEARLACFIVNQMVLILLPWAVKLGYHLQGVRGYPELQRLVETPIFAPPARGEQGFPGPTASANYARHFTGFISARHAEAIQWLDWKGFCSLRLWIDPDTREVGEWDVTVMDSAIPTFLDIFPISPFPPCAGLDVPRLSRGCCYEDVPSCFRPRLETARPSQPSHHNHLHMMSLFAATFERIRLSPVPLIELDQGDAFELLQGNHNAFSATIGAAVSRWRRRSPLSPHALPC
jgi:hypothetical protein